MPDPLPPRASPPSIRLGVALALAVPLLALLPLGRLARDWVRVARLLPAPTHALPDRGFDWVQWIETDGRISARFVFPRSPAADAGLRAGDVFVRIEDQMIFGVDELKRVVAGLPPGAVVQYEITRADAMQTVNVRITRYPTLLYPIEPALWLFTVWGFLIGALLHVIGLAIAIPLARSSLRARYALGLLLVSSLWIFSNLARLLLVEFFGPAGVPGTGYDWVFQALTLLGLIGWLLFPALLMSNVLTLSGGLRIGLLRRTRWVRYLPPFLLGLLALGTVSRGSIGPITLDLLAGPLLFYAACYIAGAAGLSLALGTRYAATADGPGVWGRWGSIVTLLGVTLVAAALLGVLPALSAIEDATLGWLVVLSQLLSLAPITLVTVATLRYGKVGAVVSSAMVNGVVAASAFVVFAATMYAIEPVLRRTEAPTYLVGGVLCVLLLLAAQQAVARLAETPFFLSTTQQATRRALKRYARHLNTYVDADALARATVEMAGETANASSAVLFYRMTGDDGWRSAAFHPAPPHLTAAAVQRLWPTLEAQTLLWARDDEVSDARLPPAVERELKSVGAAVVIPIRGEKGGLGLLALADRRARRRVYNLEDLDFLRILCGQFGLGLERLALLEREKLLARAHAEARLVALRAQINPHFLFNALNTIASLVAERPADAEEAVEHLSAIFRHTLRTADSAFVPLGEEIDLVQHYLAVEGARFGPALEARVDVPPALRGWPVPAFAVQTLVENAVKHGLAPRRGGGSVWVVAREQGGALRVEVGDDGVGMPAAGDGGFRAHYGIGLQNVDARLVHLYAGHAALDLQSAPGDGTVARLHLPPDPDPSAT